MSVVIDTSLAMTWCFADEATPATDALLRRIGTLDAVAPPLFRRETSNVLLTAERRGRITETQTRRLVGLLERLPIRIEDSPVDTQALVALAREHRLGAYDADYLLLAQRLGADLATLDVRLAKAAATSGVPLAVQP